MSQSIWVALLPDKLPLLAEQKEFQAEETVVVVIDTLRFCTAASTGLANGASAVLVVGEVDQAKQLAATHPGKPLLCGERECKPIPGFQLGNSPLEYVAPVVSGRELIFTTTNGTRAVGAAMQIAEQLVLGTLINCSAAAKLIAASEFKNVVLLCSGTNGAIASEDVLAAGAILSALLNLRPDDLVAHDEARLALYAWRAIEDEPAQIKQALSSAMGGQNVLGAGYQDDISVAAQVDALDVVPCCKDTAASPPRFEI